MKRKVKSKKKIGVVQPSPAVLANKRLTLLGRAACALAIELVAIRNLPLSQQFGALGSLKNAIMADFDGTYEELARCINSQREGATRVA